MGPPDVEEGVAWVIGMLTKCSSLLALYGLVVLNFATSKYLARWHMHRMFWAFKLILVLGILQESLLAPVADRVVERYGSCLECKNIKGIGRAYHLAEFWSHWLPITMIIRNIW